MWTLFFLSPVHEILRYVIRTGAVRSGVQPQFSFSDRRWDREQSAFLQDEIRVGQWAVEAPGIRFDEYRFVVAESAWSPRVGIAYFFPSLGLALHPSESRLCQTPAIENILLASSRTVDSLSRKCCGCRSSHLVGIFYQLRFTKGIAGKLRIDANAFRRDFRDYADDDILLNTGVTFRFLLRPHTFQAKRCGWKSHAGGAYQVM